MDYVPINSKFSTRTSVKHASKFKKYLPNYVLLLPFFLLYAVFTLYPLIQGFIVSLFNWRILGTKTFVGLKNYIAVLQDTTFYETLWHTTKFVLYSTPVLVILGFLFALIVNVPLKGKTVYRAILFAPTILAVSVVSSVWQAVLGAYGGLANTILGVFGIKPVFWLSDPHVATTSIIIVTVWWTVGFNMILYLAGLQDIPEDYYEAAKIDGASAWKRMWHITIPSLKRVTYLVTFLQIIASFKVFSQVYLITRGGPAGSTRTLIQYLYEVGFQKFRFGSASTMAYLLFFILLIISILQLKLLNQED